MVARSEYYKKMPAAAGPSLGGKADPRTDPLKDGQRNFEATAHGHIEVIWVAASGSILDVMPVGSRN